MLDTTRHWKASLTSLLRRSIKKTPRDSTSREDFFGAVWNLGGAWGDGLYWGLTECMSVPSSVGLVRNYIAVVGCSRYDVQPTKDL